MYFIQFNTLHCTVCTLLHCTLLHCVYFIAQYCTGLLSTVWWGVWCSALCGGTVDRASRWHLGSKPAFFSLKTIVLHPLLIIILLLLVINIIVLLLIIYCLFRTSIYVQGAQQGGVICKSWAGGVGKADARKYFSLSANQYFQYSHSVLGQDTGYTFHCKSPNTSSLTYWLALSIGYCPRSRRVLECIIEQIFTLFLVWAAAAGRQNWISPFSGRWQARNPAHLALLNFFYSYIQTSRINFACLCAKLGGQSIRISHFSTISNPYSWFLLQLLPHLCIFGYLWLWDTHAK